MKAIQSYVAGQTHHQFLDDVSEAARLGHRRSDERSQARAIRGLKAKAGSRYHLVAGDTTPIGCETGLKGQFSNEFPLSAAASFPERVGCINFTQKKSGTVSERLAI